MRSGKAVLVDADSGLAAENMFRDIRNIGIELQKVEYLTVTHGHFYHIGRAGKVKEKTGYKVVMHQLDAEVLEKEDSVLGAANFYGERLKPCKVDLKSETRNKETLKII